MQYDDFKNDVIEALNPVIAGRSFVSAESDGSRVRIEMLDVVVSVIYDRSRSFELAVEFEQKLGVALFNGAPFNLGEVFRYFRVPNADERWFFQTTDYNAAIQFLHEIASILDIYCSQLLDGSKESFEGLGKQRANEAHKYTESINLNASRPFAEKAWLEKDYAKYIQILNPNKDALSKAEKLKLRYAEKKASGNGAPELGPTGKKGRNSSF